MLLVYYITGHGFGHATRSLAVIDALLNAQPDWRVVVRSGVPGAFLADSATSQAIEIQTAQVDTGMVQIDSLQLDIVESARTAAAFYQTFADKVATEAAVLQKLGAGFVVGDIPPLAFAAAAAAGVRSIAVSNFTWDWIYEAYPEFQELAPDVLPIVRAAYGKSTASRRLPFAGGFAAMGGPVEDVPLVARQSALGRAAARERLALPDDRPVVLSSFGGHGAAMPYEEIARSCDITLLLTEREAGDLPRHNDRLHRFGIKELARLGLRYEDLVAAADVVVTKPGYGIVSECIANETALLYTFRGHFAEQEVLVSGMSKVLRCRSIEPSELRAGRWQPAIDALLQQPPPGQRMAINGASVVANSIVTLATTVPAP